MTPEEFRQLLETTVEDRLREVLGDDEPLADSLRARLLAQRTAVAGGERGLSLADVRRALDDR